MSTGPSHVAASAHASHAPHGLSHLPHLATLPAVRSAIDTILAELRRAQASITGARPADTSKVESHASWLKRNNELRGRATMYPYVGAGIGNGALVQLADGSVKWDMINGIGVNMFGHSDSRMVEAALESAL